MSAAESRKERIVKWCMVNEVRLKTFRARRSQSEPDVKYARVVIEGTASVWIARRVTDDEGRKSKE